MKCILTLFLFINCIGVFAQSDCPKNPSNELQKKYRQNWKENKVKIRRQYESKDLGDTIGVLRYVYHHNEEGRVFEERNIIGENRIARIIQTFNTGGKITSFRQYFNERLNSGTDYYYDESGKLTSIVKIRSNGSRDSSAFESKKICENGKQISYYDKSSLVVRSVSEFTSNSNTFKNTVYSKSGDIIQQSTYTMDDRNNVISKSLINNIQNNTSTNLYKFDQEGNQIKDQYYENNVIQYTIARSFLTNGLVDKEYKFDQKGNQIKFTRFEFEYH